MRNKTFVLFAAALLLTALSARSLAAQEDPTVAAMTAPAEAPEGDQGDQPVHRDPLGARLINLPTPFPVRSHALEVMFLHRFQQAVQDGDSHNLWGLDSGADVGLGLAWGISPRFDVALLRSSFQEDYELSGKALVVEQSRRMPLSAAVRLGVDRLGRAGAADPTRPFGQLILSRRLAPGFNLLLAPSWGRDTERLRNAWNVPVGLTVALPHGSLLEIEVIPKNHDLDGSLTAWHLALSKQVGGHIFQFVLGNSRATTVDQYLGGDFAGGFRTRDVRLGFNLIRDFDF
jgi:hypothetical protein